MTCHLRPLRDPSGRTGDLHRLTVSLLALLACLLAPGPARAQAEVDRLAIANVTCDSASVSWFSTQIEVGRVFFAESVAELEACTGTYTVVLDDAGPTTAHHVTLGPPAAIDNRLSGSRRPLRPETLHVMDVQCAGVVHDNAGRHYSFRTGPVLQPRLVHPEAAIVPVLAPDGSLPGAATLFFRLESGGIFSQLGSGPVLSGQGRILDLAQTLREDLGSYWDWTGTQRLHLQVSTQSTAQTTTLTLTLTPDGQVHRLAAMVLSSLPAPPTTPPATAAPTPPLGLTLELAPTASGSSAVVHSMGTTVPVSQVNLWLSLEDPSVRIARAVAGSVAAGGNLTWAMPAPSLCRLEWTPPSPPAVLAAGELALLDLAQEPGHVSPSCALSLLAVSASRVATVEPVLRPAADAGANLSLTGAQLPGGRAQLDGRHSTDSNVPARPLTYRWRQLSGPAVVLEAPASPTPSFAPAGSGLYAFGLTVDNGILPSPEATVTLGLDRTASSAPWARIASREGTSDPAGDATTRVADTTVGRRIVFDGRGSTDRLGSAVTYAWAQNEGPAVSLPGPSPVFAFVPDRAGLHGFALSVTGPQGAVSRPARVRVRVGPPGGATPSLTLVAVSGAARGEDLGDAPDLSTPTTLRVAPGATVTVAASVGSACEARQTFFWRQLSGPAVLFEQRGGGEDSPLVDSFAELRPRVTGLVEFACAVRQSLSGAAVERRIRVAVEDPDTPLPSVALGAALAAKADLTVAAGSLVRLAASGGASRVAWVQLGGPEVETTDPRAAQVLFTAPDYPGQTPCTFQVRGDDGRWGEPAVATVLVSPPGFAGARLELGRGLHLLSVPVRPQTAHDYTVEDLAADTESPVVVWTEAAPDGRSRFRTWLRGQGGRAPSVDGATGYFVVRKGAGTVTLPFSGWAWPAAGLTRTLSPGAGTVGFPASVAAGLTAAELAAAARSPFAVRWRVLPGGTTTADGYVATWALEPFGLEAGMGVLLQGNGGALDLAGLAEGPAAPGGGKAARGSPVALSGTGDASWALGRGWSLVSPGIVAPGVLSTAGDLAAALSASGARINRVLGWTGSLFDEYAAEQPVPGAGFLLRPGESVLVHNAAEATVVTTGARFEDGRVLQLAAGFNLVGSSLAETLTGEQLLASAEAAGVRPTAVMERVGGRWLARLAGSDEVSSAVALRPGGGVALAVTLPGRLLLGHPSAPSLGELALEEGTLGVPYGARLSAQGTPPLTWELAAGSLPVGMVLAGDGSLDGTPAATGTFTFTARVSNVLGSASRTLVLTVTSLPSGLAYLQTNDRGGREFRHVADDSVLVEIPGGSFAMGSSTASVAALLADTDETPIHQVTLSRHLLGRHEVTNAQYARFLAAVADPAGPYWHQRHHPEEPLYKDHTPRGWTAAAATAWATTPDGPVLELDWYDAYAYCAWAGLRLPTEAELEHAARGLDGRSYPWGTEPPWSGGKFRADTGRLDECCAADATDGFEFAAPVESYGLGAPGPRGDGRSWLGISDLSGNAWEWAGDWYGERTYSAAAGRDPIGPTTGTVRVMRGGGWFHSGFYQRSAYRGFDRPDSRFGSYGLRVARSEEPVIETTALPAARQGTAYTARLSATGSVPVTWSLVAGELPAGLALSEAGVVSGIPATVTARSFTVLARGARGWAERSFLLFVDPAQVAFTGLSDRGWREFRNERDGSGLIEVPAAAFSMGSTTDSVAAGRAGTDELPVHSVSLSRYFIGKSEVTNAQYRAFLEDTTDPSGPFWHQGHHPDEPLQKDHRPVDWTGAGSSPWSTTPSSPVAGIDWYDAYAYCAWAHVRLPTEAELEFAARGSDFREYPWGAEEPGTTAEFRVNAGRLSSCCAEDAADGFLYTAPVGSYGPGARTPRADGRSPFGALDLAGNLWEWALDWYAADAYSTGGTRDPQGPASGVVRCLRGGSWFNDSVYLRTAYRGWDTPSSRFASYGLRVAASFEPTIATTGLPVASQGNTYLALLSAVSSTPVTWTVVAGALPAGLVLGTTGQVSGTPTTATVAAFSVRARSALGFAERSYLLFVDPAGLSATSINELGYRELRNSRDASTLIEIPAGSFSMGSTTAAAEALLAETAELPLHAVSLSRYFLGKAEVTCAQYKAFLLATADPAGPSLHQGHHPGEAAGKDHTPLGWNGSWSAPWSSGPESPVVGIDWYDAYAYCAWAGLRLPSEAELEYAARGADFRLYPWGNDPPGTGGLHRASCGNLTTCCSEDEADGFLYTAPAGTFGAGAASPRADGRSPFGLHDLSGNAWEWAQDWFALYGPQAVLNPAGPAQGSYRVLRGGSWFNTGYFARSAYRGFDLPASRFGSYGFRVAR